MKDKLTELIDRAKKEYRTIITDYTETEYIVAVLHNKSVIVPPYKVGTKVYVITSRTSDNKNLVMFEDHITHYHFDGVVTIMCLENHLGVPDYNWDKVFLTKEEAEAKLKECKGNEQNT